jgi:hypothetical protein
VQPFVSEVEFDTFPDGLFNHILYHDMSEALVTNGPPRSCQSNFKPPVLGGFSTAHETVGCPRDDDSAPFT